MGDTPFRLACQRSLWMPPKKGEDYKRDTIFPKNLLTFRITFDGKCIIGESPGWLLIQKSFQKYTIVTLVCTPCQKSALTRRLLCENKYTLDSCLNSHLFSEKSMIPYKFPIASTIGNYFYYIRFQIRIKNKMSWYLALIWVSIY